MNHTRCWHETDARSSQAREIIELRRTCDRLEQMVKKTAAQLENAWKFSNDKPLTRIAFGAKSRDGVGPIFYIRDNGAGLNSVQIEKLFGIFQRLHLANEFPGLGAGLAIVQRIIRRHGGEVWAESIEGEGATFYFTL